MRVSYGEDLANHTGPESCGSIREDAVEALTGVRAGWVSSHEKVTSGAPTAYVLRKAIPGGSPSQDPAGLRGVLDPMHARKHLTREESLPYGSRDIPGSACATAQVRAVNPKGAIRR